MARLETVWEADYDPLGRRTETRVYGAVDATWGACVRAFTLLVARRPARG
jgi:hypothetical protein